MLSKIHQPLIIDLNRISLKYQWRWYPGQKLHWRTQKINSLLFLQQEKQNATSSAYELVVRNVLVVRNELLV